MGIRGGYKFQDCVSCKVVIVLVITVVDVSDKLFLYELIH